MHGAHEPFGAWWSDEACTTAATYRAQASDTGKAHRRDDRPSAKEGAAAEAAPQDRGASASCTLPERLPAPRISQLMRECQQCPPRSAVQRRNQTLQDLRNENKTGMPPHRNTSILSHIHDDR